jgi:hypothetical protein
MIVGNTDIFNLPLFVTNWANTRLVPAVVGSKNTGLKSVLHADVIRMRSYSSLARDWGKCQLHAQAALPPVPDGQKIGWTPEPVWTWWRREKSQILPGIHPRPSSPYPVTLLTELSRLHLLFKHGTISKENTPLKPWDRAVARSSDGDPFLLPGCEVIIHLRDDANSAWWLSLHCPIKHRFTHAMNNLRPKYSHAEQS